MMFNDNPIETNQNLLVWSSLEIFHDFPANHVWWPEGTVVPCPTWDEDEDEDDDNEDEEDEDDPNL